MMNCGAEKTFNFSEATEVTLVCGETAEEFTKVDHAHIAVDTIDNVKCAFIWRD